VYQGNQQRPGPAQDVHNPGQEKRHITPRISAADGVIGASWDPTGTKTIAAMNYIVDHIF